MAGPAPNKSSLHKQRELKKLYERILPSLELKRQQLTLHLARARLERRAAGERLSHLINEAGRDIPMLAFSDVSLSGLLKADRVMWNEENVVGVRLPRLDHVDCKVTPYSFFSTPAYVDAALDRLKDAVTARMAVVVMDERVRRLEFALRRVTQRVNLFEKKLIPETTQVIRRIQIFLADADRDAVVRSKIAKAKRQAALA